MADNYLSFNYKNDNYSATLFSLHDDFNGSIINEGEDLTFFNLSQFTHDFTTSQFGNQSYFLGTTKQNREFTFPILLQGLTLIQYKDFLRWLDPDSSGILSFDYDTNFGYDVKVNNISEGKFTVNPNCGATLTYNIELEVGFITRYDFAARWIPTVAEFDLVPATAEASGDVNNSSGIPFVKMISSTSSSPTHTYVAEIRNFNHIDNYLKISWNMPTGSPYYFQVADGADVLYKINTTVTGEIYTQYGLLMNGTSFVGGLTTDVNDGIIAFTPNTAVLSPPSISRTLTFTFYTSGTVTSPTHYIKLYPISREIL